MGSPNGIFRPLMPLDNAHVREVPACEGVYIIYDMFGPIYVGRSGTDIRSRLSRHMTGQGNRILAAAIRAGALDSLLFEYEEIISFEQAESRLIAGLGTDGIANLRHERDPAYE